MDPLAELHSRQLDFKDGRGRFREIFCTVLNDHGGTLPDYKPCEKALIYVDEKLPYSESTVDLGPSGGDYLIGLVPGLAWQCVREWLHEDESGVRHISGYGYDARLLEVDGLSSTKKNAAQLRDYISQLPINERRRPIILIGYSKGAADILEAVTLYPEIRQRVVAVVSIAGAIGGSPLAGETEQSRLNLLSYIPWSGCEIGDEGALESLLPETRREWLERNALPETIRYYSVIAYPEPERVSFGLTSSYRQLKAMGAGNDGQIIFYDQLIPGSTLLAFVNADHWAMSIPVARQMSLNRLTFANKNEFPREALLEAVLRYVEEDLTKKNARSAFRQD